MRLTAGALSLKILVYANVLFFLLKVRMEPLLSLRADEFGELAQDLNHFLDRVALIVKDLDQILSEVVTVGSRLGTLNRHAAPPVVVAEGQAAQYQAFGLSLREMALHRLAHSRDGSDAA